MGRFGRVLSGFVMFPMENKLKILLIKNLKSFWTELVSEKVYRKFLYRK